MHPLASADVKQVGGRSVCFVGPIPARLRPKKRGESCNCVASTSGSGHTVSCGFAANSIHYRLPVRVGNDCVIAQLRGKRLSIVTHENVNCQGYTAAVTQTAEIALLGSPDTSGGSKSAELTSAQRKLWEMVLDSVTSTHSSRNYVKALDLLFAFAGSRPLNRALLLEYRTSMEDLAPSTVNVRLAAVRKMVTEAKRNGLLSAEEAANLTDVPNIRQQGTRLGNWLTKEQAR